MFEKYRRKEVAELRPVTQADIDLWLNHGIIPTEEGVPASVSVADSTAGSPKIGDMIARNPKNHFDQWLVAEKYFEDNFEIIEKVSKDFEGK